MKAELEHIKVKNSDSSFLCYWNISDQFEFNWHYHPEYELTYIVESKGLRLVGDHVCNYEDGDLIFLGPNLPHTWASDNHNGPISKKNKAMVIQFPESIFNFQLNEFRNIKEMFSRSSRGIHFKGSCLTKIKDNLIELEKLSGISKMMKLFEVLEKLSSCKDYELIASKLYEPVLGKKNEERLDQVCQFLHQKFAEDISLDEIATIANMTITSFCRFFKKMTGQTFTEYLNELRIGRACQLLVESNKNISEIAFESGFNSSTHFNRIFSKEKNVSPSIFRKKFKH